MCLAQIKDKKYHEKFLDSYKDIYLVGIGFDFQREEHN